MKFFHIADTHLGAIPDAGFAWSEERRSEIWESFRSVVAKADREEVDLLLIAGDLFHRQPLMRELKEVNYLFSTLKKTKVVFIIGNHDYLKVDSYYLDFPWSENVTCLRGKECESVVFEDLDTEVYGLSYHTREIKEPKYNDLQPEKKAGFSILLGHGGDAKHIPIDRKKLLLSGFDYIALGHIHRPEMIEPDRMAYAGALEPIDSNDTGEHGFWVGEITKAFGQVQFCPLRKCQYVHETIQLSSQMTNMAVQTIVKNLLANRKPYELYKIFLTGTLNADTELDLDWIRNQEAVVDVICSLRQDYDYDRLREENEQQLLGRFIAAMQSQGESEVYKKALEIGVEALLSAKFDR